MLDTSNRQPAFLGTLAFVVISWGSAAGYVAAHNWFGSRNLLVFAFFCVLLAIPTYGALRLFDRQSAAWPLLPTYAAAAAFGILGGVGSTFVVASILGGWIGAFSFPVLLCWLAGSLVAYVGTTLLRRPGAWLLALAAVAAPFAGVVTLLAVVFAQPPDLLIHVKSGTSPEQAATISNQVLGEPGPSGRGYSLIEGIGSVGSWDSETEQRIHVTFVPGTSSKRRAEVVQRVLASPFVSRTSDLGPNASLEVSGQLRPGRE